MGSATSHGLGLMTFTLLSVVGHFHIDRCEAVPQATSSTNTAFALSESEFVAKVEAMAAEDLRSLPFSEVEHAVHLGWWAAVRALVVKSHEIRLDLTAPVRKAVGEVKKEADVLMKWLEPSYAQPEVTRMASRWSQNFTHVVLTSRFAPKWEAPGANLAVFSTERGQGHVNPSRTSEAVKKALTVNMTNSELLAEIIAEAGNTRKRYKLEVKLFDEIAPARSDWSVELRRAQGSMQMSTGAQIPELRFALKKRWLDEALWPWLAVEVEGMEIKEVHNSTDSVAKRTASVLACAMHGQLFCPSMDLCMDGCGSCPEAAKHRDSALCIGSPLRNVRGVSADGSEQGQDGAEGEAARLRVAHFEDEDLREGFIGGQVSWRSQTAYFADEFYVLGTSAEPLAVAPAAGDIDTSLSIPHGTALHDAGSELRAYARNELASAVMAKASVVDRVQPPPVKTVKFTDIDGRRDWVNGTLSVHAPSYRVHIAGYEVHAANLNKDGSVNRLKRLLRSDAADLNNESLPFLTLHLGPVDVPRQADRLSVHSFSSQGILSDAATEVLHDIGPPTLQPASVSVSADKNKTRGFASFQVTVKQASCKEDPRCDAGNQVAIYWGRSSTKFGAPILRLEQSKKKKEVKGQVVDVVVPSNVDSIFAVAVNEHGESRQDRHGGVSTPFRDAGTASSTAAESDAAE